MIQKLILTINPGSTSTKIGVFKELTEIFIKTIKHPSNEIEKYHKISDQFEYRKEIILNELKTANIDINSINIVLGRGGLIKPVPSGVFEVNAALKEDLKIGIMGDHASNLGGLIADDIARSLPCAKAYIADPVVVDEMDEIAKISGHPNFKRKSIFHALNQKAIARTYADSISKKYEELNLIVAHLGGGISVGAHYQGKVIDVNQALDGEGPFSPERSGTLPVGDLVKLCFSGEYKYDEIKKMITGKGGYVSYFNTNDALTIEKMAIEGDAKAILIQNAMAYQVAKEIGAMSVVLKGKIDAILLTGGLAYGKPFTNYIIDRVNFIAPVKIYPGEDELKALAFNGLLILKGEAKIEIYK